MQHVENICALICFVLPRYVHTTDCGADQSSPASLLNDIQQADEGDHTVLLPVEMPSHFVAQSAAVTHSKNTGGMIASLLL